MLKLFWLLGIVLMATTTDDAFADDEIKISPCAAWSQNDRGGMSFYGCDDLDFMQKMATEAYNAQKQEPPTKEVVIIVIVPADSAR